MFHSPIPSETASTAKRKGNGWLRGHWPEMVGAATALIFAAIIRNVIPEPDVAWQLWIAHQIRMGARLYVDIIETNPPLWFWEAMPLDWAGSLLHIPSHVLLVAAIGVASALSIWATGRLIRDIAAPWRALLLAYAALTLLLMPLISTGQREQFVLIGILPYIMLAAARREERSVRPWHAIAIAAGAALGLALKHYFLIAPILIEVWLLARQRRAYRPFRPETLTLAALGAAYATAVLAITPDYLRHMVALNRTAYASVGATGFAAMMRPMQIYWLITLMPLLGEWRVLLRSPHASTMTVAALGFALGWLIQFKGFPYHSIPTSGCLMLAVVFLAVENWPALRLMTRAMLPTILLLPLAFTAWYGPFRDDFTKIVQPMLAGTGPHDSVAFISDQAVYAWPLSLYREAPYPSRQYGMWILRAVAYDHGRTPALTKLGRQVSDETAQDYRCAQPLRIIFSRKRIDGFDLKDWLMESPSFADVMRHYRPIGHHLIFDVFQLNAPFPKPPAEACRKVF